MSMDGEPVGWRWRIKDAKGNASWWAFSETNPELPSDVLHDCEPLYAAPSHGDALTDEHLAISGLNKDWNRAMEHAEELRAALQAVADFMNKDAESGDCDLWTDEYDDLHATVIAALSAAKPAKGDVAQPSARREAPHD